MRVAAAVLRALGWTVLALVALTGLAVSAFMAYASTPWGRATIAAKVIRLVDDQVAGKLELGGLELLPGGKISIRDFKAYDPDGRLVLEVDRVLLAADVTRLRNRSVGVEVELDGAAVLIDEDAEGRLSLLRAFAPAHPSPPGPEKERRAVWRDPLSGWTIRLRRLTLGRASVWWQDAAGQTRVELQDLELAARAIVGPGRARAELKLRGESLSPAPGPLALDLRAMLDGDRLVVPLLRAQLGGTSLQALAEGDLQRRVGRAGVLRATVDRAQAQRLVKGAPAGADLDFAAYAEADGSLATAAIRIEPSAGGPGAPTVPAPQRAGGGEVAAAVRVDGARALGFDVALRALDPAAILAAAPRGSITLAAHGGLAGAGLASARGNLELALDRSTLRGGELGPAAASVTVEPGAWIARKLSVVAPGLRVDGQGAWRKGGAASGTFTADVADLRRATDNAGKLLGAALPRLGGSGRIEAQLSGTAAAPVLAAHVSAPSLSVSGTTAAGVEAKVDAAGPFRPGTFRVSASVRRVSSGAEVLAQTVTLDGALEPEAGAGAASVASATLTASGVVPTLGKEPVSLDAAATLAADRASLRLSRLILAYPGTHYGLEEPATLAFAGPRVDRLSLASGPRRITVSGGVGARRTLDARVEVVKLDLARLPVGVLPPDLGIAGELSADATARGPLARPVVEGKFSLEGGAFRTEKAVALEGTARWDGEARRLTARTALRRGPGGAVELEADLPLPLRERGGQPVSATLRAQAVPLPAILDLAGSEAPIRGALDATVHLAGTVAAPTLRVQAGVADGAVRDLEAIGVQATLDAGASLSAAADVALSGKPAVKLEARAPLALSTLLSEPRRIGTRLAEARLTARAAFPGLDLAALSGRLGVPARLRGRLTGEVKATGTAAAPRGTVALGVEDGAWDGYAGVSVRLDGEAKDDRVEARVAGSLSGQDALRLTASLGAPVERLETRAGLRAAALRVDGAVPLVDLEKAAPPAGVALGGIVQATFHAEGTLARPTVALDATGKSVRVEGRPIGQVQLTARAGGDRAAANLALDPTAGGKLTASATLTAPISLDLGGEALRSAPAEVRLRADAVDLGFLPALAPGTLRAASGRLDADVTAAGPLADLTPRGTVKLTGGRLGLLDYGDWSGITLDGAITADAVELRSFEARRGEGRLTARAALRGLSGAKATLDGRLDAQRVTLTRAGTDLGTLTFGLKMSGGYEAHRLDVRLDLPNALVRLADKLPRNLQPLESRPDIVVGATPPPRRPGPSGEAAGAGSPLTVGVHLVAPGRLEVQRDVPRIRLELKADVTYERQGGGDYMTGSVEVVRGTVEPLSDRRFDVKRGRVTFTGGPPSAAVLDVEALYDNPNAQVTVDVTGPLTKPDIALKSNPPLDDAQIAMLIATGQTELKAGGGGAAGAGQSELSGGAAQKVGFAVFNTFIRNQLPFSTGDVSLDASSARVSGYIPGTPIYVGYTRRFDANKNLGENENEVRVEYAITPHWSLEGRFGTQSTGGASLIWSKDY